MGEKNNINVKIENHGVIPKEEEHATPEELYSRLIDKIKRYHPSSGDLSAIDKAYNFAKKSHGDQKRKSGEPYIIHPIHTALINYGRIASRCNGRYKSYKGADD